jgi:hypothetical protein
MEPAVAGVNQVEMTKPRKISPHDLDRLYAHGSGSEELEDISRLVQNVRSKYLGEIDPDLKAAHLAALMQVVNLTDKGDLAARPASKVNGPARQASGLPKRRRRFVLQSVFATLSTKLALGGAAVAMAATGGLAATGHLPDQAQTAISHAVDNVGIDIPVGKTAQGAAEQALEAAEQAAVTALERAEAATRAAEQKAAAGGSESPDPSSDFGSGVASDAADGGVDGPQVSEVARDQAQQRRDAGQANRPAEAGPPAGAGSPPDFGPPSDSGPIGEPGPPESVPQGAGVAGDGPAGGSIPIPTTPTGGRPAGVPGGGRP